MLLDLVPRTAIDMTLSRLTDQGVIRRLVPGVYDFPKVSRGSAPFLQTLMTSRAPWCAKIDTCCKFHVRAAHMLGLTTQVPAKMVYLMGGPIRTKQFCGQTIEFRHASAKTLIGAGRASGTVFQALRYLGKDNVDNAAIHQIIRSLGSDDVDDC